MAAQFAALGVQVEVDETEDDRMIGVLTSNWQTVMAFVGLGTQWRVVSRGLTGVLERTGLDYVAADALLRARGLAAGAIEDLRVMEDAALAVFGEATDA